jgi:hypothetical protein
MGRDDRRLGGDVNINAGRRLLGGALRDHPAALTLANLYISMTNSDTPKDGDFAAFLERKSAGVPTLEATAAAPAAPDESDRDTKRQTLDDVIVDGEEPTEELMEELEALKQAPPLSDEELARQALEHPGADGDPSTPE